MPRKIRQLMADLQRAGFVELARRAVIHCGSIPITPRFRLSSCLGNQVMMRNRIKNEMSGRFWIT